MKYGIQAASKKPIIKEGGSVANSYIHPIIRPNARKEDKQALINLFGKRVGNFTVKEKGDLAKWFTSPQYKSRFATRDDHRITLNAMLTNLNNSVGTKMNYIWEPAIYGKSIKDEAGNRLSLYGFYIKFQKSQNRFRGYSGAIRDGTKFGVVVTKDATPNEIYHELSHVSDNIGFDMERLGLGINNNVVTSNRMLLKIIYHFQRKQEPV